MFTVPQMWDVMRQQCQMAIFIKPEGEIPFGWTMMRHEQTVVASVEMYRRKLETDNHLHRGVVCPSQATL